MTGRRRSRSTSTPPRARRRSSRPARGTGWTSPTRRGRSPRRRGLGRSRASCSRSRPRKSDHAPPRTVCERHGADVDRRLTGRHRPPEVGEQRGLRRSRRPARPPSRTRRARGARLRRPPRSATKGVPTEAAWTSTWGRPSARLSRITASAAANRSSGAGTYPTTALSSRSPTWSSKALEPGPERADAGHDQERSLTDRQLDRLLQQGREVQHVLARLEAPDVEDPRPVDRAA